MSTAAIRTCPAWCEDHCVLEPVVLGLDEMQEQHNSRTLAWSDSGKLSASLSTIADDPVSLMIDGTDSSDDRRDLGRDPNPRPPSCSSSQRRWMPADVMSDSIGDY